jgi:hypothetical protein
MKKQPLYTRITRNGQRPFTPIKSALKPMTRHLCPPKSRAHWTSKQVAIATRVRYEKKSLSLFVAVLLCKTIGQLSEAVQGYKAASNAYMRKPVSKSICMFEG